MNLRLSVANRLLNLHEARTDLARGLQFRWYSKLLSIMQTTFEVNTNELNDQFFERFRYFFAGRKVRIIVEETATEPQQAALPDQRQWFSEMEDLQKAYPPQKIPLDVEINKIANGMYGRTFSR